MPAAGMVGRGRLAVREAPGEVAGYGRRRAVSGKRRITFRAYRPLGIDNGPNRAARMIATTGRRQSRVGRITERLC